MTVQNTCIIQWLLSWGHWLPLLTQMVETQAQRQPASIRVLQLLFILFHDGLNNGGGHVTVTRAHCNHSTCQRCHANHLRTEHIDFRMLGNRTYIRLTM